MPRLLLAAIGTIIGSLGCAPPATVSARLQAALEHEAHGEVIRISDLTEFEWERFVALGPYTTREAAEAALGFPWPEFERFGLSSSDSFSLLVFTKDGSVVHVEKHPRCKPDFGRGILQRPLAPEVAVISIKRDQHCAVARAAAQQGAAADGSSPGKADTV